MGYQADVSRTKPLLKVFLDLGAKQDPTDGVVCIAAVVFKPNRYKQFVRRWNSMLKRWNAGAFHATDFFPGGRAFKRNVPAKQKMFEDDSRNISLIVGRHVARVLLVAFRPEEYERTASPGWKRKFGTSVHSMGVQVCLLEMGWWAEGRRPNERFQYFMESGDKDENIVRNVAADMQKDAPTAKVIRVNSFSIIDKGTERGLEAADLMAWHWNKYYMDKMRAGRSHDPRKDFAALIAASKEQVYTVFLIGDNLKFFLSRVPKSELEE